MKVLILGASGATGRLVVMQLIKKEVHTRIVVRESAILPEEISNNNLTEIVRGSVTDFDRRKFRDIIDGCDAVVSCLGHNLTLKGIYGRPQKLVCSVMRSISETITAASNGKFRLILMNTTGYTNTALNETNTSGERIIFALLKGLLPPQKDNVCAADYLLYEIGTDNEKIEWIIVRPDTLINEAGESEYEIVESPIRSPIFNAGETSRINVSHFMAELLTNEKLWQEWKFRTPVIYNKVIEKE